VRGRLYSTQAVGEQVAKVSLARSDPKVSRLENGTVVAAVENTSPVTRIAAVFNAGSRYETGHNVGVTHAMRCAASLSNKKTSALGLARGLQQIGGSFSSITTREHAVISVDVLRDDLVQGLQYLTEAALEPQYLQWEVDALKPRLELDIATAKSDQNVMAMEYLHQAAYRNTLGQSLFCPEHKLGAQQPDALNSFFKSHYKPSNMAIVATGCELSELIHSLQHVLGFGKGSMESVAEKTKSTYHGGEVRVDTNDELVHVAVVTPGASLGSKDLIPLALLQKVMGGGPSMKYSSGVGSKLVQAIGKVASGPFAASALNINYSDSGLFGFYTVSQAEDAGKTVKASMAQFAAATKSAITEEELNSAKNQLKSAIHMSLEDSSAVLQDLGAQALLTGQVLDPAEIGAAIDKVTVADVQAVAKKVINGKPSMVSIGNLINTPYLDQLM